MIERIYLDVDDVLNTLSPFVLHSVGCPVDPSSYANYPRDFGYNLHDVANHWLGENRYTEASLWASIPRSLWVNIPETPFCHWLIEAAVALVGRENVSLATSATKDPESLAGKLEWIHTLLSWAWAKWWAASENRKANSKKSASQRSHCKDQKRRDYAHS